MTRDPLRTLFEQQLHRYPPYLAFLADAYNSRRSTERHQLVHQVADPFFRHLAVVVACSLEIDERRIGKKSGPDFVAFILNDPVSFLDSAPARQSRGVAIAWPEGYDDMVLKMSRIVKVRNDLSHGRRSALSDSELQSLFAGIISSCGGVLTEPILRCTATRKCASTRQLDLEEWRGIARPRTRTIETEASAYEPDVHRCRLLLRGPGGRGLLLDLHPYVRPVALADPEAGPGSESDVRLGLLAPPAKDQPAQYTIGETGCTAQKVLDPGDSDPRGPADVEDGWVNARVDPVVQDSAANHGFHGLERIGEGSFGVVYRTTHSTAPARMLALKVLHRAGGTLRAGEIRRLEREIDRMKNPDCKYVVRYESFEGATRLRDNPPWFTMEYVEGPSLAQGPPGSEARRDRKLAERVGLSLVTGAAWLHCRGIVHRDLRPENVILRPTRDAGEQRTFEPVIVDLGLARFVHPGGTQSSGTVGVISFGVAPYAPGEQRSARNPDATRDPRVDVHALGQLLKFILSGYQPPDPNTPLEHPWAATLERATSDDPTVRPRDASALLGELNRGMRGSPGSLGVTLEGGLYVVGGCPFRASSQLIQVVVGPPHESARGWSFEVELPASEAATKWREAATRGLPVLPLLSVVPGQRNTRVVVAADDVTGERTWPRLSDFRLPNEAPLLSFLRLLQTMLRAGLRYPRIAQLPSRWVVVTGEGAARIIWPEAMAAPEDERIPRTIERLWRELQELVGAGHEVTRLALDPDGSFRGFEEHRDLSGLLEDAISALRKLEDPGSVENGECTAARLDAALSPVIVEFERASVFQEIVEKHNATQDWLVQDYEREWAGIPTEDRPPPPEVIPPPPPPAAQIKLTLSAVLPRDCAGGSNDGSRAALEPRLDEAGSLALVGTPRPRDDAFDEEDAHKGTNRPTIHDLSSPIAQALRSNSDNPFVRRERIALGDSLAWLYAIFTLPGLGRRDLEAVAESAATYWRPRRQLLELLRRDPHGGAPAAPFRSDLFEAVHTAVTVLDEDGLPDSAIPEDVLRRYLGVLERIFELVRVHRTDSGEVNVVDVERGGRWTSARAPDAVKSEHGTLYWMHGVKVNVDQLELDMRPLAALASRWRSLDPRPRLHPR